MVVSFKDQRKIEWEEHRKRVKRAVCSIDHHPPTIHVGNYLHLNGIKDDVLQYQRIIKHNMQLMISMNGIQRTQGRVRTFEPCIPCDLQRSSYGNTVTMIKKTEMENFSFGQRLFNVKRTMDTRRPQKTPKLSKSEHFDLPTQVLNKYENLRLPRNLKVLHQLLRPKIFFELSSKGDQVLGRIVIQLFTEACPQVVLEFVRLCKAQNKDRIRFVHLFPNLWLEGKLQFENKKLSLPKIEFDKRALDHGKSAGVLSFPGCNVKGFIHGCIDFAISFRPLSVLNGKRIGFGRVLQGIKLLKSLKDCGTIKGTPLQKIILTNCGML